MKGTDVNNNILPSKKLRGKIHAEEMNWGPNNILRSCDGSISFHVPKAEGQVSPFTRSFFTLITGANGKKCLGTTKTIF